MNLLATHHLTLEVPGKTLCRDLNFTVRAGEIWGILGANGSGKTTFLHTLAGLRPTHSGEIYLYNHDITKIPGRAIAQKIGILLQETSPLFPQTVLDFCRSGRYPHLNYWGWERAIDQKIVHEALHLLALDDKLQQSVLTLSGGERRRLAIATLLAQAPKIYLLDEPTNHLDLRHQFQILHHLKKLAQEQSVAIVMILHDIALAYYFCQSVLLLAPEKILQGPTADLLTIENLIATYQCTREDIQFIFPTLKER